MVHIIIILDKSESMLLNKFKTISSLNSFIDNQKELSKYTDVTDIFSLVTFNDSYTIIINKIPIQEAPSVSVDDYHPNGMTALYDAIGYVITSMVDEVVDNTKTICCVISDGEENSSKYFTSSAISNLISSREKSLEMVYLGSNQDAIHIGTNMLGIIHDDSCMTYEDDDMDCVFECLGKKISQVRTGKAERVVFTNADREIVTSSSSKQPTISFNIEYEEEEDYDCVFETLGGHTQKRL